MVNQTGIGIRQKIQISSKKMALKRDHGTWLRLSSISKTKVSEKRLILNIDKTLILTQAPAAERECGVSQDKGLVNVYT